MLSEIGVLTATALTIGFFHSIFGPDHYLPFIVMSKARHWSMLKTGIITLLCGIGHVLSSVILGLIGISLGIAVFKLEAIESFRGELAAWFLLIFGFTYFLWGLREAIRNKPHSHLHVHDEGDLHEHSHGHREGHLHLHEVKEKSNLTPWILFTIFVFGPCEPLIPLVMYPAAKGNIAAVLMVVGVFGFITISTMLASVFIISYGLLRLPFGRLERYSHAFAGLSIFLCAGAIKFFQV